MLRRRKTNFSIDNIKQLDVFTKVQADYSEPTTLGGGMSILCKMLIVIFIYLEVQYYLDEKLTFVFKPDADITAKLKGKTINLNHKA